MDLMEKLFNYKKNNNLSWVNLCKKTGVSNTSLKTIYRKERIAGDQVKFKIAKFLPISAVKPRPLGRGYKA